MYIYNGRRLIVYVYYMQPYMYVYMYTSVCVCVCIVVKLGALLSDSYLFWT